MMQLGETMIYKDVLPLLGLKVVDLGIGLASALTAKFLAEAGANVVRLEPITGDPFYDLYAAYGPWRSVLSSIAPASSTPSRPDQRGHSYRSRARQRT